MGKTLLSGIAVLAIGLLSGCGDDGTDSALAQRRAAERAGDLRAEQAEPTAAEVEANTDGASEDVVEVTAESVESTVEPTGVVVPVAALDNSFRPQVVEIEVGDEVLWENRGLNEHNVLRVEGEGWGVEVHDFQSGAAYAHVFTEPGEYQYYCSIHGSETVGMVGTVVVTG